MAPRSTTVVLVRQDGADLAVQVRSRSRVVFEQDGPDYAFGTEVVFLENRDATPARFQLWLAPVLQGITPNYTVEQIVAPNNSERFIAEHLSQVNRQWFADAPANSLFARIDEAIKEPNAGRLHSIAINTYLDALARSGQSGAAVNFLKQIFSVTSNSESDLATVIYRRLKLATALRDSLQADSAIAEMESIAIEISKSPRWKSEIPALTRHWFEVNIAATLGVTRIFAGRARGDRQLIKRGGDVISSTLKSIEGTSDYFLRAQLTEYLAGYYNFILDRSNNISAELYRRAETLYARAGERVSVAAIRNNQAYAELGRGNIESALQLYLETLDLQQASQHLEGKAHVRARLGYLYFTLGDYRRAEIRFKEAIAIYRELKLPLKLTHNQLELSEVLRAAGRAAEALSLLGEIRSGHASDLSPEDQLRLLTQIAAIRLDQNKLSDAEQALGQLGNLDRFKSANWQSLQASIRLYFLLDFEIVRARIDIAKNNMSSAGDRMDRALGWLGDSGREPLQQLQLLHLQMLLAQQHGDNAQFVRIGDRALSIIEAVREKIDFHTQGPAWTARTSHINSLMVAHFLNRFQASGNRQDLDRAFRQLETARARNLRDTRARTTEEIESEADAKLRKEMQAANQELIRVLLLDQSAEPLEQRLAKAEERYQLDNTKKNRVRSSMPVLSIESIRAKLDENTQARILLADKSSGFMIVISRNFLRVISLPGEAELKGLVEKVAQEMNLNRTEFPNARKLAQLLFPAAGDIPKTQRLLIESDGIFSAVPYSVLLNLRADTAPSPSVATVPSLSELFAANSDAAAPATKQKNRKSLVIFSDPAFSLTPDVAANDFSSTLRSGLGRLPYTRVEAEAVAAHFPKNEFLSFSNANASIENVIDAPARNARILHIAAHGFASANDPLLLGLALANSSANRSSGLLTVDHVNGARYGNELVIISACESARGQVLTGEGVMSVARAFLGSGAKATLSTLWPVPDRANAEFMKAFYFSLTQLKHDPAEALTYAQQELKHSSRFQHPYYWGAFVLHVVDGSFQPVLGPSGARAAEKSAQHKK